MKIEIKNRCNGEVIYSHECEDNSIKKTVAAADLRNANLSWADLRNADLSNADLSDANLSWADLSNADLSNADLSWADLSNADLSDANLSWADLRDADLSNADLSNADLSWADLSWANLLPIRDDIWSVLSSAPSEVPGLIDAIKNGRIDGSTYDGECSCLVGTIAKERKTSANNLGSLKPNSSRPAEKFFLGISKGDTPETSQFSALALQWCQEWLDNMTAAFSNK